MLKTRLATGSRGVPERLGPGDCRTPGGFGSFAAERTKRSEFWIVNLIGTRWVFIIAIKKLLCFLLAKVDYCIMCYFYRC